MAEDAPAKPLMEEGFVDISVDQDGGLLKKILTEGTGDDTPKAGAEVSVHYVGTLNADGSKFDSSRDRPGTFDFDVGNGRVIRGWDVGILTMKKNEKAILRCSSEYGYGDRGSPPKIPGGAVLDFEVELFSWKIPPGSMSTEERSQKAAAQKDLGNAAFKEQKWEAAVEAYEAGVEYVMFSHSQGGGGGGHSHGGNPCSGAHGDDDDEEDDAPPSSITDEDKQLAVALLSNCAMAKLKVNDPEGAIADCSRALTLDGDNVKAVFRRGQGHLALGNTDEATADASRVLELDPANTQAVQLKRSVLVMLKEAKQKEKALAAKMFGGK